MSKSNSKNLPEVVVFGEALTDFIIQDNGLYDARPGGACWNMARVVARLGIHVGYAGAVSKDVFGQELYDLSIEAGCDERFLQRYDLSPLLAMVINRQPPNYFFIGDNSADLAFDVTQLPTEWMQHAKWVHFGCISLVRNPLADQLIEIAEEATKHGIKISFDPNWRNLMVGDADYYQRFLKLSALASFIKVSDEDLRHLFPDLDHEAALVKLRSIALKADVLYTMGEHGMTLILQNGKRFSQPVIPIDIQDTVGAGDASVGSYLASLLMHTEYTEPEHLVFVAAAAAYTCEKSGAYAPSYQEVTEFLKHYQEN